MQQRYKSLLFSAGLLVIATTSLLGTERPTVLVSVYNDAGTSTKTLENAEEDAVRVFEKAGLMLIFIDGNNSYQSAVGTARTGRHLFVRILPRSKDLNSNTFGVSFLGSNGGGAFADVFFDRAETLSEGWNVSLAQVLGHVMAHEVGHLLLGSHAHSRTGIMRPHWQHEELLSAERGRLIFTTEQADTMRKKVRLSNGNFDRVQVASGKLVEPRRW